MCNISKCLTNLAVLLRKLACRRISLFTRAFASNCQMKLVHQLTAQQNVDFCLKVEMSLQHKGSLGFVRTYHMQLMFQIFIFLCNGKQNVKRESKESFYALVARILVIG